jgi:hypothetical protein
MSSPTREEVSHAVGCVILFALVLGLICYWFFVFCLLAWICNVPKQYLEADDSDEETFIVIRYPRYLQYPRYQCRNNQHVTARGGMLKRT